MKVNIDKGHGIGLDRGAGSDFIAEEEIINVVGDKVIAKLRNLGHEVLESRPTNTYSVSDSLNARCSKANNWGADIFVSIHANAGGGYGTEVYTNNAEKLIEAQRFLQVMLQEGITIHSSNRQDINSGIKDGSDLAVINGTSMKAMLLEICFVDSQSDVNFYRSHIENIANAIVYGITGVDLRNQPKPQPQVPEKQFNISMSANIQDIGLISTNGINSCKIGTEGKSKRLEMFSMSISDVEFNYSVHEEDIGDTQVVGEGQVLGSINMSKRIEGITINVAKIDTSYKLLYRCHIQDVGTTEWCVSGQYCGTKGQSKRVECIEVKIIKK